MFRAVGNLAEQEGVLHLGLNDDSSYKNVEVNILKSCGFYLIIKKNTIQYK